MFAAVFCVWVKGDVNEPSKSQRKGLLCTSLYNEPFSKNVVLLIQKIIILGFKLFNNLAATYQQHKYEQSPFSYRSQVHLKKLHTYTFPIPPLVHFLKLLHVKCFYLAGMQKDISRETRCQRPKLCLKKLFRMPASLKTDFDNIRN